MRSFYHQPNLLLSIVVLYIGLIKAVIQLHIHHY
nr:MAG TPA: hypothetical protein [Caudoviricetes sp.]